MKAGLAVVVGFAAASMACASGDHGGHDDMGGSMGGMKTCEQMAADWIASLSGHEGHRMLHGSEDHGSGDHGHKHGVSQCMNGMFNYTGPDGITMMKNVKYKKDECSAEVMNCYQMLCKDNEVHIGHYMGCCASVNESSTPHHTCNLEDALNSYEDSKSPSSATMETASLLALFTTVAAILL